jgi:DHA1 family bicyclomycin/chloramphenicol resistance-like MFS transporter
MRRGLGQTIGIGAAMQALAGLVMLLGLALGWSAWPAILLPVAVYVAGLGCAGPQSMAGALTPYPTQAGTASSLFGFIRQTWSAIVGAGVGFALGATAWPMALAITAMGGMTLLIWAVTREARAQPESIAAV